VGRITTASYEKLGDMVSACLVDVYDTLLCCDFESRRRVLPALAGVDRGAWADAVSRILPATGVGQVSRPELYDLVLRTCGVKPREELVRELVATDLELTLADGRLFDDALPFLHRLRSRGIAIAIVSNCGQHTRNLLVSLGVAALADVLVLSCEVGLIKPSARIFRHALNELGVEPGDALFVDDQAVFCAGAEAVGVRAVQIVRDGDLPPGAVRSLLDVLP
jgi:HAD superfamily hydrolase (TIGR01509 family)